MDYAALKNELSTDPRGYGYAPYWANGSDWILADMLNQVRDSIRIDRTFVNAYEVFEAIVPAEWIALSADEKQRIQLVLNMGQVYTRGTNTKAVLQAAFPAGSTTRTNLLALLKRSGSRAEELFGEGVSVTWDDIARARRI